MKLRVTPTRQPAPKLAGAPTRECRAFVCLFPPTLTRYRSVPAGNGTPSAEPSCPLQGTLGRRLCFRNARKGANTKGREPSVCSRAGMTENRSPIPAPASAPIGPRQLRRCQAENPLIGLYEVPEPSLSLADAGIDPDVPDGASDRACLGDRAGSSQASAAAAMIGYRPTRPSRPWLRRLNLRRAPGRSRPEPAS